MKYIIRILNVLNRIKSAWNFNGTYAELNRTMKTLADDIILDSALRREVSDLINDLGVEKQAECLASLKNPGVSLEELALKYTLDDLTDRELLNYFGAIMWSVTIAESGDLLLFKYNECIWNVGWHKYAMASRGKIVDRNTLEVVSYPFDKFFNLNEHPLSQESLVVEKISKADRVSLTNKLDGSTIIVSRYNDNALITTNGSFNNIQTKWAREIFEEKYPDFIHDVPEGYTFVFELIHPENRIILDYGETQDLYLIAVRENALLENGIVAYDKLLEIADSYGLNIVQQEVFTSLSDICRKARDLKDANKEGWVIRTESGGYVNYMFKLKLEEYFILHRAKSHVSMKNIYNLYVHGNLDEFLNTVDDNTKQEVVDMLEEINICFGKLHNEIVTRGDALIERYNIPRGEDINLPENREKLMILLSETKKDKLFGTYVLKYVKGSEADSTYKFMRVGRFLEIYEYFNSL